MSRKLRIQYPGAMYHVMAFEQSNAQAVLYLLFATL